MGKSARALMLTASLLLHVATSAAQADPFVQSITTAAMTSDQFNANFQPLTGVSTNTFTFMNSPTSGVVESQVFRGIGPYSGLFAYAYQFDVNNVSDSSGTPTSVNSASLSFNSPPTPVHLGIEPVSAAYVVTQGQVGGMDTPEPGAGGRVAVPASIAWQPGVTTGSLTFQYLDPSRDSGPLEAGARSGTIVVLTEQPQYTLPFVSIQNPDPQIVSIQGPDPQMGYPQAYAPISGLPEPIPAPEPITFIGWTGAIGALALVHRFRRDRRVN